SVLSVILLLPCFTLFPYTTLFRSCFFKQIVTCFVHIQSGSYTNRFYVWMCCPQRSRSCNQIDLCTSSCSFTGNIKTHFSGRMIRSEEHTSELQSRENLVCRLLLEK